MAWYVGPNHAGGYHYRLCKMPEGGIGELTEECFQQTPLEFDGEDQWINYKKDRETGELTEVKALQTREGTFPGRHPYMTSADFSKKFTHSPWF